MKKNRQPQKIDASENIIRKPLFWVVFLSMMFLIGLPVCLLAPPSTESADSIDLIADYYYSITGVSMWIVIAGFIFVLLAINLYFYFRFKLIIHQKRFSVTPIFGPTYDVPFSSIKKVELIKWSNKGSHIDIKYSNKKLTVFYTVDRYGEFKQKGVAVLSKKFEEHKITIVEDYDFPV
ncbi:hypothetical protein [Candidatus Enterococcus ferrettii]|uniref:Uncharacterized protein n=1 Tax=Candidatus Enterococcus ferrettii TaxID=2815324 RepID=A0ABV0EQ49_9ENTE|nr:hypothetical protein [Enterococcus sp. 665A]MBO1341354.1 hypothetical protein [Enterococcus sp. 665A]